MLHICKCMSYCQFNLKTHRNNAAKQREGLLRVTWGLLGVTCDFFVFVYARYTDVFVQTNVGVPGLHI